MKELNLHKIDFLVALISEFGKRFGLSNKEAYRYINRYGGVQMFFNHYDILHTLSFRDMVEGMTSDLIRLVMENEHLSMVEAFDKVYNSYTYESLLNPKSQLYYQSPGYVYACLCAEA